jgi:hypothetical protein
MKNIELHVLYNNDDVELAAICGLAELTDNEVCENCGSEVGFDSRGDFEPLALVLDEENVWTLCLECSGPVITPAFYDAAEDEDDNEDDEFEEFDYTEK